MPPVTKIALGFVLVFGALRLNGFDLLLDPAGWGLCAAGLSQLQRSAEDPFARARSIALVMFFLSFAAMIDYDRGSGEHLTDSPVEHVIGLAGTAGALIAVWLTVEAVIRRLRSHEETSRAARLDVLRWAVAGLGVLGVPAGYGYAVLGPVTVIAWFAALVALIIVLYRSARLPCLSPTRKPVTG
ncbi:hypothetical protein [Nonomuraea sp. NPDC049480]|uniref:hypothetical protein n=1 Tax=Nonomuraea sp. NPDC049480 TaxID=3364353 RepID=UPI00379074FF